VHALRVNRTDATPADLTGRVICHELRFADGRVAIPKGRMLDAVDAGRAMTLDWSELHLLALDDGDVHEDEASDRIARLVAGEGVTVQPPSGGHWPIVSLHRGLLAIDNDALEAVNALDGPCVYSLFDGQVVDVRDVVARAKIIPFAVTAATLAGAESIASRSESVVRVRPFVPCRVGAVIHQSMGDRAISRFRDAVTEKLSWFGSSLCALHSAASTEPELSDAFRACRAAGAKVILIAGTKAMDMLDPTFAVLDQVGARMVRHGVPAHPGSLLWLADWDGVPIVGMPTCGLFAQATVFDLVISRILTGERVGRRELGRLAQGGFLTRDMSFRLPAYRSSAARGAVE
jgi:hypothetical protein